MTVNTDLTRLDDPEGTIPVLTRAQRLRIARENAGMEQGDLSSLIGVSRVTISNYEQGRAVRRPVMMAWAKATGVKFSWLMAEDAPDGDGAVVHRVGLEPTTRCLIAA
jgi:transcriptional regulator with XRE-family HTH domain